MIQIIDMWAGKWPVSIQTTKSFLRCLSITFNIMARWSNFCVSEGKKSYLDSLHLNCATGTNSLHILSLFLFLQMASWKDWCWSWRANTLATRCEEPTHWKRPWCWERSRAGRERNDRRSDDWMASPTQWTWVWVSSGSWWQTWRPGVPQSMGLQRVGLTWATELNRRFCLAWAWNHS